MIIDIQIHMTRDLTQSASATWLGVGNFDETVGAALGHLIDLAKTRDAFCSDVSGTAAEGFQDLMRAGEDEWARYIAEVEAAITAMDQKPCGE